MLVSEVAGLMPGITDFEIVSDVHFRGASLDSRLTAPGSLFFGVPGECVDGGLFAADALARGAAAVIVSNAGEYGKIKGNKFLVEDAVLSIKGLGKLRYKMSGAFKIAVTGSFGKTGTKEMLKLVFGYSGSIYGTEGNKNNELGVTLTGCGMDESDTLAIEMGTNAPGEIAALADIVKPDMAVITSTGHAHAGRLGGIEGVIREKLSITKGLKPGGVLIVPYGIKKYVPEGDYKTVSFGENEDADIHMYGLKHHGFYVDFRVSGSGAVYRINHPYKHIAEGALAAIAAARIRRVDEGAAALALQRYMPAKGRGNIEKAGNLIIIDDTYNAGFEAVVKAAESLNMIPVSPKYAVFGETGEIEGYEKEIYAAIASLADKYPSITFYLCGGSYKDTPGTGNRLVFIERRTALEAVKGIKKGVVLIKASRSRKFEEFAGVIKRGAEERYAL